MPVSWGDRRATLIMPTDLEPSTELVRDWVGSALTSVPGLVRARAALLTAELVTNARGHGSGPCVLHLSSRAAHRVLLVAVEDTDPVLGAGWAVRGELVLVAALSDRWGVEWIEGGKIVWAELHLTDPH
jgi:hypothetical protein